MTHRRYALSLVLLLAAVAVTIAIGGRFRFGAHAAPLQDGQRVTVTGFAEPPYPLSEGKADGKAPSFILNRGGDIKAALLSTPPPEMWLMFPPDANQVRSPNVPEPPRTVKVSLSPEALERIKSFWELSLDFHYRDEIEKFSSARMMQEEMAKFSNAVNLAAHDLQKFQITTSSGTRNISSREGWELIKFINRSSADLVEQAKEKN